VAYQSSCTISVEFNPKATGTVSAPLTFYVNGSPILPVVQLSGTGD
jgi:hypothetical protein